MTTTTFSIRLDEALLERIEQAATQAGESRTQYILRWLPEYHDSNTETSPNPAAQEQR